MLDISATLLFVAGFLAVYIFFQTFYKKQSTNGKMIPGPKGLPFLGMGLKMDPRRLHIQILPYVEQYGEIFQMTFMGTNVVYLNSVRLIKKCFAEDPSLKHVMNDRPPLYYCNLIPEGKGSIVCAPHGGSQEHNRLRKAFTKGFHIYGQGVEIFEEKILNEIDNMIKRLNGSQNEIDVRSLIQHSVISIMFVLISGDVIVDGDKRCDMTMGYLDGMTSLLLPSNNSVLLKLPFMRYLPGPWKKAHDNVVSNLDLIAKELLLKNKETFDPCKVRGIVDYLISLQKEEKIENVSQDEEEQLFFSDGKITGLLADIIVGGVVTTTGTLVSVICCLLLHPEVQKRGQDEVFRVIGKDRKPTLKDKSKCQYIEAIINEVNRFITLVPLSLPHYVEKDTELEGYHVPANSVIVPNAFAAFHDEKIWPDPWTFRPERFLDANGDLLPKDHPIQRSLIPFSIGKRRCIGEEFARSRVFLFVATMIQRWTFVKSRDEPKSCDPRSSFFDTSTTTCPKQLHCRAVRNF